MKRSPTLYLRIGYRLYQLSPFPVAKWLAAPFNATKR